MSLPDNEAMHVPSPSVFAHRLTSLGRTVFQDNRIEAICPEKTRANSLANKAIAQCLHTA